MGDVHGGPGIFGKEQVAGDHDVFGDRRDAGKSQFR
jgi:hypothetical protein